MYAGKEMKSLVNLIKLSPPDLMVVSMEGMKFPTWRLLIALHSPMLANLLQTLRPGDEGLIAITLPLSYNSVSSMLTILGEGGSLDHLGEAAQLLSPKTQSINSNSVLASTFAPTKVPVKGRSEIQTSRDNKKSIQLSLANTNFSLAQKTISEKSPKESTMDVGDYSDDAAGTISVRNLFEKSAEDLKSENSGDFKLEDKASNGGSSAENLEEVFIDVIDMKTEIDRKQSQEKPKLPWPSLDAITAGLVFPNYNSMTASLDEWSSANFSPLVKASSGNVQQGYSRAFHTFRCPHRKARQSTGRGIRRQKANIIERVDCPFLIDTKVNTDGSCVVTKAVTEHVGHDVSEEQFQKYRR